jgi:capsular exopolysaccharide synthesis family protein
VRDLVRARLGGTAPKVSVNAVSDTAVVEVTAESTDPARAAAISNAYASAFVDFRRDETNRAAVAASKDIQAQIDGIEKEIRALDDRLAALPACTGANPPRECEQRDRLIQDRDSLLSQAVPLRQRLNQLQLGSSGGPQIIAAAAPPTEPVRPRPVRNGLVGLGVGLTLGIALAFAFEQLDDSIKSKEDLERLARDLPVLGLIPTVAAWKNRAQVRVVSQTDPTSSAAEAYRSLRTSIRFIGLDRAMRTIQITSPNAAEGKTTTVANLAVALARAGERVVIVSCDLRRPRIHEFFELSNDVGFMSVVLGEMPLSAALQAVPNEPRLQLLATGPIPANPSELLSSNRSAQVLAALRKEFSVVLIDCPPVLPVTDAAVLSARVDGTLLVITVGTTTGKQVTRSLELLRQVGAPLIGTVLNGVGAQGSYGYVGYYGQPTGGPPAPPRRRKAGPENGFAQEA